MPLSQIGKKTFLLFFLLGYSLDATDKLPDFFLVGKFNPAELTVFESIPLNFALQSGVYMHREALKSFKQMAQAASKEGFQIYIISAFRNFSAQKNIWEGKFGGNRLVEGKNLKKYLTDEKTRALKILEYSSMPGTSRHHWGTDIDIGFDLKQSDKMLTNDIYKTPSGKKFYRWMTKNSLKYGFCQPYKDTPGNRNPDITYGYQEEKWHWSYRPLSSSFLKTYLQNSDQYIPSGFEGSNSVRRIFLDYVRNISSDCL